MLTIINIRKDTKTVFTAGVKDFKRQGSVRLYVCVIKHVLQRQWYCPPLLIRKKPKKNTVARPNAELTPEPIVEVRHIVGPNAGAIPPVSRSY